LLRRDGVSFMQICDCRIFQQSEKDLSDELLMAGTGCYYVSMSLIASKIAQYKVNIVVLLQQVSPLAIPTELP